MEEGTLLTGEPGMGMARGMDSMLRRLLVCAYLVGYPVGPAYFEGKRDPLAQTPKGEEEEGSKKEEAAEGGEEEEERGRPTPEESNGILHPASEAASVGGCYVAWCTVSHNRPTTLAGGPVARHHLVRTQNMGVAHNPLSWRCNDAVEVGPGAHLGSYLGGEEVEACHARVSTNPQGCLVTIVDDDPNRPYKYRKFATEGHQTDYHGADYTLFWLNVRENVQQRVEAYRRKFPEPVREPIQLEIETSHRGSRRAVPNDVIMKHPFSGFIWCFYGGLDDAHI